MVNLVERFEQMLSTFLEEDGFSVGTLLALHHDDSVTVARLAIPQEQIFDVAMKKFVSDLNVKEVIFGLDCFTQPGQGTRYNDVLTVYWWAGEHDEDDGFRFGVINYRPAPDAVIDPIDWNNTYWTQQMRKIIVAENARLNKAIADVCKRLGLDDSALAEFYAEVEKRRNDIISKS